MCIIDDNKDYCSKCEEGICPCGCGKYDPERYEEAEHNVELYEAQDK